MLLFFLALPVAAILTLAAAGDLVFADHTEWPVRRKAIGWTALLLLLATAGASIALVSGAAVMNHPAGPMLLVIGSGAVLSIVVALCTAGRFRWLAALAAAAWALSLLPLVKILTAPGFLR